MARPKLDENSETIRLQITFTQAELDALTAWRRENHIDTTSKALRVLARFGIEMWASEGNPKAA